MTKFPEANVRLFQNVFICRVCKSKTRAPVMKVLRGKISCSKCNARALRPKRKK